MVPLTRLTSIRGSFHAHVVAARLSSEGIDVELRNSVDGAFGVSAGELARMDLFVPSDQVEAASVVLLAGEVEDALDPAPARPALHLGWWLTVAALLVMVAGPVVYLVRA